MSTPNNSRFQFSLRGLLLVTSLTAVLLVFGRTLLSILAAFWLVLVIFLAFLIPALIPLALLFRDVYDFTPIRHVEGPKPKSR